MPTDPKRMESDPSKVARSIELLSTDPGQYGKVVAQEAFDHFIASRNDNSTSSDKGESDKDSRQD